MTRLHHGTIAAAALFLLLAPTALADSTGGDPVRGAKLYSDNCGRCHNPRPPATHRDREWSLVIQHMRITAGLPGQQARDIEAFLRSSNDPPRPPAAAPPSRATPLSGAELVTRYGCRGCHVVGGEGGRIGPALDGVIERRGEEWVRTQIENPREHNPATVMPQLGLSDAEVQAIIEFLRGAD